MDEFTERMRAWIASQPEVSDTDDHMHQFGTGWFLGFRVNGVDISLAVSHTE